MKTCTRCGASAYVDADPYCEHEYREPPEPEWCDPYTVGGERLYMAGGPIAGEDCGVMHPTRDGAIALWQERWTWGPATAALFGWLCERVRDETPAAADPRRANDITADECDEVLAEVVAEMREHGRARFMARLFSGTFHDYRIERFAMREGRGFSLERKGSPGMLQFGSSGPLLAAVRTLLKGGDPFAPKPYHGTVAIPPNTSVTRASATASRGEPIGVCLGDGPPDEQGRATSWVRIGASYAAMTEAERRELLRRINEEASRPARVEIDRRFLAGLPTENERTRMQGRSPGIAYTLEEWAKHKRVLS